MTNADLGTNGPPTRYNGAQFVFTRRFTGGFTGTANYSYGKGYTGYFYSFRKPQPELESELPVVGHRQRATATSGTRSPRQWLYELPFGQGKRFGSGSGGFLNRVIGNWSWTGLARIQTGRLIDFGNVRVVGMSAYDLVNSFQTRIATDPTNQYRSIVYMLPQDIIDNTLKAFNVTATGYGTSGAPTGRYLAPAGGGGCYEVSQRTASRPDTGYGDCGVRSLVVQGPMVMRWDFSLVKEIPIAKRVGFRFEWQVFNVFNRVNFTPTNPGSSPVVNGGYSSADNYTIRGAVSSNDQARTSQLAFRLTW